MPSSGWRNYLRETDAGGHESVTIIKQSLLLSPQTGARARGPGLVRVHRATTLGEGAVVPAAPEQAAGKP